MADDKSKQKEPVIPPDEVKQMPRWIMTFADLMSLLLCFFVLLLSFSEISSKKFKEVVSTLKDAFAVQRPYDKNIIPKGDELIEYEFSPGKKPTIHLEDIFQRMKKSLKHISNSKLIQLEKGTDTIKIILQDSALFAHDSAELSDRALPVLAAIIRAIRKIPFKITIIGHTDNKEEATKYLKNTWQLSSIRAATIVNAMLIFPSIQNDDLTIVGMANTQPLNKGETPEEQSANRRIELILKPLGTTGKELGANIAISKEKKSLLAF